MKMLQRFTASTVLALVMGVACLGDLACVAYLDLCVAARCDSVHGSDDTTDVRPQDRPLGVFEDKNGDPSAR